MVFARPFKAGASMQLPCGQCHGCRLERSRQAAVRCLHEAQMHRANSFITLTYSDEFLPGHAPHDFRYPGDLDYRDFQAFAHRLRKKVGSFRHYTCGEYGERSWRPHFHACIFGIGFADREYWRKSDSGFPVYRSKLLESTWGLGLCELGDVSFESAAYVARYCMKKVTGVNADSHYAKLSPVTGEIFQLTPEFVHMSLKPGIGATWFDKYQGDVLHRDAVVVDGVETRIPRYYDKRFFAAHPTAEDLVKRVRVERALAVASDNTPDRLRVREIVSLAKTRSLVRSL
ncbi:replication initiator protein [Blackfly microvirus SF02]|uniref:Replication initiator protein n=1 Tax=Blackfly microvirus SF02 TaxID=2576452 RepID=A0A4P8PU55_9VIRU|nr:replication initiator protein [Blackfly microvirus SF02]